MRVLLLSLLLIPHFASAWHVLPMAEPNRDASKTFSFPVHSHLNSSEGLIVGAAKQNAAQGYSLCFFDYAENFFRPCAHEKVTFNGTPKQENPLFNNGIPLLAMMDERTMAFGLQSDLKRVFVTALPGCTDVLSSGVIKDVNGKEIETDIVVLTGGNNYAYAAFKDSIAVIGVRAESKEVPLSDEELEAIKREVQESGDQQLIEQYSKEITTKDGKHSRKVLEKRLEQIAVACVPAGLEIADMHWCLNVSRLYIAAQDKIFVAHMQGSQLQLVPLISEQLLSKEFNIGSINKIRSMFTTTFLDYLIIQSCNGIYAVPLLNFNGIHEQLLQSHGTIASDGVKPFVAFSTTDRAQLFKGRHFATQPQFTQEMIGSKSPQAMVGAGILAAGPIEDILVKDDAIYAAVNNPHAGHKAGIYYSQAIFGQEGAIVAWTAWQPKVLTHDEKIFGMAISAPQGAIVVATGDSLQSVQTIKRSVWNDAQKDDFTELALLVERHLPQSRGGVQGIFDCENYIGVLGLEVAILFDSSTNTGMVFEDAAVKELGALVAGQLVEIDHQKLLVLGGLNGVAALDLNNAHLGFKKIGNYQFVRKIIADEDFLYILADRSFERIKINDLMMDGKPAVLANSLEITGAGDYGIFLDCAVSHKCALIAHSAGLHRVGNGKDIRTDSCATLNWTRLAIPDCSGPVISLVPISVSGKACDWARAAGQFYIISGSIAHNNARLNRFAVESLVDKEISDSTLVPLHDLTSKDHISSFVEIGNFTPHFATDGTLFLTTGMQRKKKSQYPVLIHSFKKGKSVMPLSLDANASINCLVRHTRSGNWIIGGDFGLIVNE